MSSEIRSSDRFPYHCYCHRQCYCYFLFVVIAFCECTDLQVSDFVADFLDGVRDDDDSHSGEIARGNLEDSGGKHFSVSVDLQT